MARPIAEALADEYAQLLEHNRSTKQAIAALQSDIAGPQKESAQFRTDIADWNVELIKWYGGAIVVYGIIVVAVFKFF